jgi:hypothetical protein
LHVHNPLNENRRITCWDISGHEKIYSISGKVTEGICPAVNIPDFNRINTINNS